MDSLGNRFKFLRKKYCLFTPTSLPCSSPLQVASAILAWKDEGHVRWLLAGMSHDQCAGPSHLGIPGPHFTPVPLCSHLHLEPPLTLVPWAGRGGFPFLLWLDVLPLQKTVHVWGRRGLAPDVSSRFYRNRASSLFFWQCLILSLSG